jgi:hypothetical protein
MSKPSLQAVSVRVSLLILTISLGQIKGKMSLLVEEAGEITDLLQVTDRYN